MKSITMLVSAGIVGVCTFAIASGEVLAQKWSSSPRAQSRDIPDDPDERLKSLLDALEKRIERAEKRQRADPRFIRSLRRLHQRYSQPVAGEWIWNRTKYDESYDSVGSGAPEPWYVRRGRFITDRGVGLRTIARPQRGHRPRRQAGNDQASDFLTELLDQAIQGNQNQQHDRAKDDDRYMEAMLPVQIDNAFAIKLRFSSRATDQNGFLGLGPYQGRRANSGYRLLYTPNLRPGAYRFELVKRSTNGEITTIARSNSVPSLEDGQLHRLLWTRDTVGRMRITVDDKLIMSVTDRSFRDPFRGFAVVNRGGDYALRNMWIKVP